MTFSITLEGEDARVRLAEQYLRTVTLAWLREKAGVELIEVSKQREGEHRLVLRDPMQRATHETPP